MLRNQLLMIVGAGLVDVTEKVFPVILNDSEGSHLC